MVILAAFVVACMIGLSVAAPGTAEAQESNFEYALVVNAAELSDAQLARALDQAKGAGVTTVMTGAVWWYLNRDLSPREYDWNSLDRLVGAAKSRGMKVNVQLSGTPDWVHPDLSNRVSNFYQRIWYPPKGSTELNHWSDFVYDVVSRYQGDVSRYEMWNEENIQDFWKPDPNPAEYAALLRSGYLSAKSAYPSSIVMFGGLSRNDQGYLNAAYSEIGKYSDASGNANFFDVLDVHPYSSINGSPQRPISPDRNTTLAAFSGAYGEVDQTFLGLEKMKAIMDNHGDSGKSIFIGEYGFSTSDTWMKGVPDYRRALYLKRAYTLARQDMPYVAGMSWYVFRPSSSDSASWAIVDSSGNGTKTFRALKQITGAEPSNVSVSLRTPSGPISRTYRIKPTTANLGAISKWEFYVDGALKGTHSQVPFNWDTRTASNGQHTIMVAAYTREGSVWPSNVVAVTVKNGS